MPKKPKKTCGTRTPGANRVVKRLSPSQPGALKWARRYGETLVCVRYRHDPQDTHRITTVELVVERAKVRRRNVATGTVLLHIPFEQTHTLRLALAHNARWNGELRLWALPRKVVEELRLTQHIVEP